MDAIKQQLLRIQQQLAGLSASQKMLTGSLIVIMLMTLFYWARFAGTSEMTTLLDTPIAAEELGSIKNMLGSRGVKYEVQGDKILVPDDRRFEIIADLGYAQLLPRNDANGFEQIISKLTPFDPASKTQTYMDHARELTLSRLIGSWPGVKSATVLLSTDRKISPVRPVEPSATIDIRLKGGSDADRRKLAESAASLVSGSVSSLSPDKVNVQIDGKSQKLGSADGLDGGGDAPYLEAKAKNEDYYIAKIQKAVGEMPGVFATVSVDLNTKSTTTSEHAIDKTKIELLLKNKTKSTENQQTAAGGEPGVTANTTLSIEQGSGSGATNSNGEEAEITNAVDHGYKDVTSNERAGAAPAIGAGLRIPDSYFIAAWKKRNPNGSKEPTDAEIDALVQRETPKFRKLVQAATAIKDADAITVETYVDLNDTTIPEPATAGLAAMPTTFGFGAKEIAIAVLAVVSLFMVSMMVRKGAPNAIPQLAMAGGGIGGALNTPMTIAEAAAVAAGQGGTKGINSLMVGDDLAGEVGEGGMLLTGHELSGEEMENKQVIEQVGNLIKENPEAAANLVKRWMNRD